jgi:hypothetical protein
VHQLIQTTDRLDAVTVSRQKAKRTQKVDARFARLVELPAAHTSASL